MASPALNALQGGQMGDMPPSAADPYARYMLPGVAGTPTRPLQDFTGAFGPLVPAQPIPIGPTTDEGVPEPRRWQYPVGWNAPIGVPGTEGLKLTSFANLRTFADAYSVARSCIQVRKEEILGLDWDIGPTDEAEKSMRGDSSAHEDMHDRAMIIKNFFMRPDPNYHDYHGWMGAVLEDLFVVDAISLYLHPSRVPGKGIMGSNLAALDVLDGTSIRPMLDSRGGKPRPPAVAYQQYLWGVPRTDMMDIILETDIEMMPEPSDEYSSAQLLYLPYTRRSWTPYGFPPVERALIPIVTGLKKQMYALDFYTEGSVPGVYVTPGPELTTFQQWKKLQDTLNAIAGDLGAKHRVIVLPPGSKVDPQKPTVLADAFDETLMTQVCMGFDVMPMELGILPKITASPMMGAGSEMAKANQEINKRKSLKPLLMYMKRAIFDFVIQRVFQQDDLEWKWLGLESEEDQEKQANNYKTLVSVGMMSVDEARVEMGMDPWGLPMTSDPIFIGTAGPIPFGTVPPAVEEAELQHQPIVTQLTDQPTSMTVPATGAAPGAKEPPPATTQQPAKPGQQQQGQRPPGSVANKPPPPSVTDTQAKMALDELKKCRKWLAKGHDLREWTTDTHPWVWNHVMKIAETEGQDIALVRGRSLVKAARRIDHREQVVADLGHKIQIILRDLTKRLAAGQLHPAAYERQVKQLLVTAFTRAFLGGTTHAGGSDGEDNVEAQVQAAAAASRRWQSGLDMAVANLTADVQQEGMKALDSHGRLDSYAETARASYEQGFAEQKRRDGYVGDVIWHSEPDACDLCASRDGHAYTFETLPGWPGDGTFGHLCEGGPRCRCVLEYPETGETSSGSGYPAGMSPRTAWEAQHTTPPPSPATPRAAAAEPELTKVMSAADFWVLVAEERERRGHDDVSTLVLTRLAQLGYDAVQLDAWSDGSPREDPELLRVR